MDGDVFEAVEAELFGRARAADAAGDVEECRWWERLGSVADYLRRLSLDRASVHYRADKAGELLAAAVRVQATAMDAYAGFPEDDDPAAGVLDEAERLLENVRRVVTVALWADTQTGAVTRGQAAAVRDVARQMAAWSEALGARAVPDDVDGEAW